MMKSQRSFAGVITLLGALLLSACQTFENPLNWNESPMAGDLVGSWRPADSEDVIRVSRTDIGELQFEVPPSSGDKRDTFIADLLASGPLHVLQVRMDTYREGGQQPDGTGFAFLQVTRHAEHGLLVHPLNVDLFSRVAEEELRAKEMQMQATTVAECVGGKVSGALWTKFWNDLSEPLGTDLKAQFLSALGDETREDLQESLAELAYTGIDPYRELAEMRRCIARHLPSATLGELLLRHADRVFSEKAQHYVRQ